MFFRCITPDMAAILRSDFMKSLPGGTYMAGGTAAALYFGHRMSVDIDLFTPDTFDSLRIFSLLKEAFQDCFSVHAIKLEQNTVVAAIEQTGFSIFSYSYKLLEDPTIVEGFIVPLASVPDIALMKLIAINQRGSCKDFIDLRIIVEAKGFTLDGLMNLLVRKYPLGNEITFQLKKSLVYFDDAEKDLNVRMYDDGAGAFERLDEKYWQATKKFFMAFVQNET